MDNTLNETDPKDPQNRLDSIEERAKRMLRYHERTETDHSIAAQVDRDVLALAAQMRELEQAANDLTDLLITNRAFLDDDDLRAAAYQLRALAFSGEERE